MKKLVKPNLFLIGGPRCGTTAFVELILQHSKIKWSKNKETHYFAKDFKKLYKNIKVENDSSFLKKFYNFNQGKAIYVGDGSIFSLYSKKAVNNILKFEPKAKFIVLVRNPIFMAYSLYSLYLDQNLEREQNFIQALKFEKDRKIGKRLPSEFIWDKELLLYKNVCSLGSQIMRLKKKVNDKNILILSYRELIQNYKVVLKKTFKFLKLKNEIIYPAKKQFTNKTNNPFLIELFRSKFLKKFRDKILKLLNIKSLGIGSFQKPILKTEYDFANKLFEKEIKILKRMKIEL